MPSAWKMALSRSLIAVLAGSFRSAVHRRTRPARSAFGGLFANRRLRATVGVLLLLHATVVYVPFLEQAFSTAALGLGDWLGLRGGGELGAVVARAEQAVCAPTRG